MHRWAHGYTGVLFNLPPDTKGLSEKVSTTETLENGAR